MTGIVEFLTARLDEDERIAQAASARAPWSHNADDYWMIVGADGYVIVYDESAPAQAEAAHIAHHDPARALAEVAAKRGILGEHTRHERFGRVECGRCIDCASWGDESEPWPCPTVSAVLLAYAGHPDFDAAWHV